jgi:hypothetical protein
VARPVIAFCAQSRHAVAMMSSKLYGEHRGPTVMPAATLRVRPDQALFHISVGVDVESVVAALPLLKRACARLVEQLPVAVVGSTLALTDFDLPHEPGKVSTPTTRLHARLVVSLPTAASFWERAQKIAEVDDVLRSLVVEGKKQRPQLDVRRDLPAFVVADPEAHRAALVARVHERARSLAGEKSVILRELRFERAVEQRSLGLDEVELSLSFDGVAELTLS